MRAHSSSSSSNIDDDDDDNDDDNDNSRGHPGTRPIMRLQPQAVTAPTWCCACCVSIMFLNGASVVMVVTPPGRVNWK